ncbi:MAG: flagellar export chaperone FliS [Bryobacterales bacterium]|nr:flagellar export chaperone FliS [Bryobacterales bacterium]
MASTPHDAYLESRILAADPLELVRILYRVAIDRVRETREHLESGDVAGRAASMSAASQAVAELSNALDPEAGGEISRRLASLYNYIQGRLVDANYHQRVEPLNEVLGLLSTLAEAWQQVAIDSPPPAAAALGHPYLEDRPAGTPEYAGQSWSA